ncbi:MAG TPA: HPP family protein [Polyangiales bacterium]
MSQQSLKLVTDRHPLHAWLLRFAPVRTPVRSSERAFAWLGALLGIFITGWVSRAWLGSSELVPLLIAPIGASTVLVFGVPASPLAQPWSVLGGNVTAALIGVTALRFLPDPLLAAALAVATTIAVTSLLGCLHPPAGAVALTAVIGGPAIAHAGYHFALVPVALNSALLLCVGLVFNNLARRSYPHVAAPAPVSLHRTADAPPQLRLGFTADDVDAALASEDTHLDVSRDDLIALFRQVETLAQQRLHGVIRCADIMSRDLVTARSGESPAQALAKLRHHALRVLPVLDEHGGVAGAIDAPTAASTTVGYVAELPSVHFELAHEDTPIDELLPQLSAGHVHEVLILDSGGRLSGIVTQTDVLAVMHRSRLASAAAPRSLKAAASALGAFGDGKSAAAQRRARRAR